MRSETERKILGALADKYAIDPDFCYMNFDGIARNAQVERSKVRRAVRSLARKGYASYLSGLWTEDGEPAGSGYCITETGFRTYKEMAGNA